MTNPWKTGSAHRFNPDQFTERSLHYRSTIPTIGLSFFKKYRINAPRERSEQTTISRTLLATDEKVFSLEDRLRKLRQTKSGLMHDLLTGRVRVPVTETREVAE